MTNKLVGVLSRFCQDPIAFTADIEAMFCQVRVSPEHCNFLKFLWWRDGDYDQPPEDYQMLVHLFGATSSPSCAGFCLRKAADEFEGEFDAATIETIRKNSYVDDCLKSVTETEKAIKLIKELRQLLARRSFRLTKFVSNDVNVLSSIPESERAQSVVSLDLDEVPVERVLGVEWNFRVIERKRRNTLNHFTPQAKHVKPLNDKLLNGERLSKSTKHKRNKLNNSTFLSSTTLHGIAFRKVSHGSVDLSIN